MLILSLLQVSKTERIWAIFDPAFSGKYGHEFTHQDHEQLLKLVASLKGAVALSGYDNELYRCHLATWRRYEHEALTQGAIKRTEVLWIKQPS